MTPRKSDHLHPVIVKTPDNNYLVVDTSVDGLPILTMVVSKKGPQPKVMIDSETWLGIKRAIENAEGAIKAPRCLGRLVSHPRGQQCMFHTHDPSGYCKKHRHQFEELRVGE